MLKKSIEVVWASDQDTSWSPSWSVDLFLTCPTGRRPRPWTCWWDIPCLEGVAGWMLPGPWQIPANMVGHAVPRDHCKTKHCLSLFKNILDVLEYSVCLWPIFLYLQDNQDNCVSYDDSLSCMALCIRPFSVHFFFLVHTTMLPECIALTAPCLLIWNPNCGLINSCMDSLPWGDERGKSFWHAGSMDFF